MININSRLEAWSRASASALSKDDVFHFRQPRSNPGAGFYKRYDDARLVLQVKAYALSPKRAFCYITCIVHSLLDPRRVGL